MKYTKRYSALVAILMTGVVFTGSIFADEKSNKVSESRDYRIEVLGEMQPIKTKPDKDTPNEGENKPKPKPPNNNNNNNNNGNIKNPNTGDKGIIRWILLALISLALMLLQRNKQKK